MGKAVAVVTHAEVQALYEQVTTHAVA